MTMSYLHACKEHYGHFGFGRTVLHALERLINRVVWAECYYMVVLDRERTRERGAASPNKMSVRVASRDELLAMRNEGTWPIDDFLLEQAEEGDLCFLSFCGGELAGYVWAHVDGQPLLFPNLRLRLPDDYVYNYAGFTLPKFRGLGLQSVRHHALLDDERWRKNVLGLIAFVSCTNWASIRGQTKSGYRRIGRLWLFGVKNHFVTFRSRAVRKFGAARIRAFAGGNARRYSAPSECAPL